MAVSLGVVAVILLAILLFRQESLYKSIRQVYLESADALVSMNKKEGDLQITLDKLLPLMRNVEQMEARLVKRDEAREIQSQIAARAEGGWRGV